MTNDTQLVITNLGTGLTQIVDSTGIIDEPVLVPTEVLNHMAEITGDVSEAADLYAVLDTVYRGFNDSLTMQKNEFKGPKDSAFIIDKLIEKLYARGIGQEQIESVISDMRESDIFGEIEEAEKAARDEYIDIYASHIVQIICDELGYTNEENRKLEESFRGRI